jgi:hypothetical protein
MKTWMLAAGASLAIAVVFLGCGGDPETASNIAFEQAASGDADCGHRLDGDTCSSHEDCASNICVPVLPVEIANRGRCWGDAFAGCVHVLIFDTWAEDKCTDYGMTVVLCQPDQTAEMTERCKAPMDTPTGEYPFAYTCCETTFLE